MLRQPSCGFALQHHKETQRTSRCYLDHELLRALLQVAPEDGQFDDAGEEEDDDGATPDCACCRPR